MPKDSKKIEDPRLSLPPNDVSENVFSPLFMTLLFFLTFDLKVKNALREASSIMRDAPRANWCRGQKNFDAFSGGG